MINAEPHKYHRWLEQLVGEWTTESEAACEPGTAPQKGTGTESVRAVGGYWVLCEGRAEMPGGGMGTMLMTLGYDPSTDGFTGTWIGSMMSHLWIYKGSLDAAEKVLTLESQGPSFAGDGGLATYRDVIEIKSADHRMLTSHVLGENGEWTQFMTANYHRKW